MDGPTPRIALLEALIDGLVFLELLVLLGTTWFQRPGHLMLSRDRPRHAGAMRRTSRTARRTCRGAGLSMSRSARFDEPCLTSSDRVSFVNRVDVARHRTPDAGHSAR